MRLRIESPGYPWDATYGGLLRDILEWGDRQGSGARVGGEPAGTLALFNATVQHDLAHGFPLLQLRRISWRTVCLETAFFLRGLTNVGWLEDRGCRIWSKWADEDGEIGPMYGWVWRNFGGRPERAHKKTPRLREGVEPTYLGVASGSGKERHPLGKTWEGMVARCYDRSSISYPSYGGRGVRVCDRWLEFSAFAEDAERLPGWSRKRVDPRGYVLDKDGVGSGFEYGPDQCQWVTPSQNAALSTRRVYVVEKGGIRYEFSNIAQFCRDHGIDDRNFCDLWTGRKNAAERYGFRLVEVVELDRGIDQVARVFEGLSGIGSRPDDRFRRRAVVTAFDPSVVRLGALHPCHTDWQLAPVGGRLNLRFSMRSCDVVTGLPFNFACYSLLLAIFSEALGMIPGRVAAQLTDAHIYENQIHAAEEMIERDARDAPALAYSPGPLSPRQLLDLYDPADHNPWRLVGYDPHPPIDIGEVAE